MPFGQSVKSIVVMSEEIKKDAEVKLPNNFIHQQIIEDLAAGKNGNRVHTRFPP